MQAILVSRGEDLRMPINPVACQVVPPPSSPCVTKCHQLGPDFGLLIKAKCSIVDK